MPGIGTPLAGGTLAPIQADIDAALADYLPDPDYNALGLYVRVNFYLAANTWRGLIASGQPVPASWAAESTLVIGPPPTDTVTGTGYFAFETDTSNLTYIGLDPILADWAGSEGVPDFPTHVIGWEPDENGDIFYYSAPLFATDGDGHFIYPTYRLAFISDPNHLSGTEWNEHSLAYVDTDFAYHPRAGAVQPIPVPSHRRQRAIARNGGHDPRLQNPATYYRWVEPVIDDEDNLALAKTYIDALVLYFETFN